MNENFYELADFSISEIEKLLAQARRLELGGSMQVVQGRAPALKFLNPSLLCMPVLS